MLEIDGTIIIAMISFIVFGFIMNAVLYKPIMQIIEERKNYISSNSAAEKEAEEGAVEYTEKREEELEKSKKDSRKLLAEGTQRLKNKQADEIKDFSVLQKNRADAEKEQIINEAKQAETELSHSVSELADMITNKVIGKDRANI